MVFNCPVMMVKRVLPPFTSTRLSRNTSTIGASYGMSLAPGVLVRDG